jgi:hypothetical protein
LISQESNYKIDGKIFDEKSEEPMPFAEIIIYNLDSVQIAKTQSDFDGKFSIKDISSNNIRMHISYVGYIDKDSIFTLENGDNETEIRLARDGEEFEIDYIIYNNSFGGKFKNKGKITREFPKTQSIKGQFEIIFPGSITYDTTIEKMGKTYFYSVENNELTFNLAWRKRADNYSINSMAEFEKMAFEYGTGISIDTIIINDNKARFSAISKDESWHFEIYQTDTHYYKLIFTDFGKLSSERKMLTFFNSFWIQND